MKIICDRAEGTRQPLIRINATEQIFVDELISIAETVNAYYTVKTTYSRTPDQKRGQYYIDHKNVHERRKTFETKYYCVEIAGSPKLSYTCEELWEALATDSYEE